MSETNITNIYVEVYLDPRRRQYLVIQQGQMLMESKQIEHVRQFRIQSPSRTRRCECRKENRSNGDGLELAERLVVDGITSFG